MYGKIKTCRTQENKMLKLEKKDLGTLPINNMASISRYEDEIASVYEAFLPFAPDAKIKYEVEMFTEGNGEVKYYFQNVVVVLFRNNITFTVRTIGHPKRKYLILPDLLGMENIDRGTIDRAYNHFTRPNNIGTVTRKKIEDWINYGTLVCLYLKKQNDENRKEIEAFKDRIGSDPDLIWQNATSGVIRRHSMTYWFEISQTGIREHIKLDLYCKDENYESFCLLSNKFEKK